MELIEGAVTVQVISLLAGLLVFSAGSLIISVIRSPRKISLTERLLRSREQQAVEILKERTYSNTKYGRFYRAYIGPYILKYPGLFERITQLLGIDMGVLENQIKEARMDKVLTAEEVVSMKLLGMAGMIIFLLLAISLNFNMTLILMAIISYILGSIVPQRIIRQRIINRRKQIEEELPSFLDLLKSVTESGLSIQEAINKISTKTKGPLAEEFKAVAIETIASGGQWKQAMENMAFRNNIDSLYTIVADILIAYEKGTPISEVLAKEATMIRQLKNNRFQERARGLSIKLIIPLAIFCLFPLLVVLAGPMLIQLGRNL